MNSDKKNRVGADKQSAFAKMEKVHPFRMLLYLSMLAIGILFLILIAAYVSSRAGTPNAQTLPFPKFFSVSTIILLISSYTINRVPKLYKRDNLTKMRNYLGYTLLLGVLFVVSQVAGWREIAYSGVYFTGKAAGTYVYLISALHIVHILGGFIFLVFLFFKTMHVSSDAVRSLIFIRDPYRRLQLNMMCSYWHFLDGLWIGLFMLFLFMF